MLVAVVAVHAVALQLQPGQRKAVEMTERAAQSLQFPRQHPLLQAAVEAVQAAVAHLLHVALRTGREMERIPHALS